jgi:mannosyl-oligosaccharide alpha-1,2-mannosidase
MPTMSTGLPAQGIDPQTGLPVGAYVVRAVPESSLLDVYLGLSQTWGGGSDSYFEYLIKYARLSNTDNPIFVNSWLTAVDSSIKTLLKV